MNKLFAQIGFTLLLLCASALATAQSSSAADQAQGAANAATSAEEQEVLASDKQASQSQDSSSQDVAQVEDEEDASAGRFIPTEQLSQDLGASFPVDI